MAGGRTYAVLLDANGMLQDFERLGPDIQRAAIRAVNRAADRTRTLSAKAVRSQLNFPASYLTPSEGRLAVKQKAKGNNPEAVISARMRGTSLARFATNAKPGKVGAMLQVKPGLARFVRNAVFLKLKSGDANIDTKSNLGLAVRTKSGQRPRTAYKPVRMRNGMWLLYGPSVAQALISAKDTGIWKDLTPDTLDILTDEFYRQLDLNNA